MLRAPITSFWSLQRVYSHGRTLHSLTCYLMWIGSDCLNIFIICILWHSRCIKPHSKCSSQLKTCRLHFSFATAEIMDQYGKLLERYEENSHEVNECVLTLMHHIAGDCDKHETLLQFPIIRKMAEIANYSSLSAVSGNACISLSHIEEYPGLNISCWNGMSKKSIKVHIILVFCFRNLRTWCTF